MAAKAKKKGNKKQEESKLFAFLGTFLTIIGFIIVLIMKKDDKYAMFYAKQGLVLFIFSLIASAVGWIPLIDWIIWVLFVIVWIMAWVNSLSGEMKDTWIVGHFAKMINI